MVRLLKRAGEQVSRRRAITTREVAKLLKAGLLVVALVLQGYFSQVHNHNIAVAAGSATTALASAIDVAAGGDTPAQPLDGSGHDLHCFICHLAGVGSASLLPSAIVMADAPPRAFVFAAADERVALRAPPAGYSPRAPPSLFVPA